MPQAHEPGVSAGAFRKKSQDDAQRGPARYRAVARARARRRQGSREMPV